MFLGLNKDFRLAVEELKSQIRPGLTAVCPRCDYMSIVAEGGGAGAAGHVLYLWKCFGPFLDAVRKGAGGKGRGRQSR